MHDHLFIARYQEEEIRARYPSKENAELHKYIANQLVHQDPASQNLTFHDFSTHKTLTPLEVLERLTEEYPSSFFAHHTLGNFLHNIENYAESIRAFSIAEMNAPNTTMKLAALLATADSWKKKADKELETTPLDSVYAFFGMKTTAKNIMAAKHAYEQSTLAYKEAKDYTYAATPALAVTDTFGQAILSFAYAQLAHHHPAAFPKNTTPTSLTRLFLNIAEAQKILTLQLVTHYQTPDITKAIELFEKNVNTLEQQITKS